MLTTSPRSSPFQLSLELESLSPSHLSTTTSMIMFGPAYHHLPRNLLLHCWWPHYYSSICLYSLSSHCFPPSELNSHLWLGPSSYHILAWSPFWVTGRRYLHWELESTNHCHNIWILSVYCTITMPIITHSSCFTSGSWFRLLDFPHFFPPGLQVIYHIALQVTFSKFQQWSVSAAAAKWYIPSR